MVFCGVCPHPPIAVPEVGGAEASKISATQDALLELGRRIIKSGADTVVIISPHAPVFRDVVGINMLPLLKGDLSHFGAGNVRFLVDNDQALAREINRQSTEIGLPVVELAEEEKKQYGVDLRLDHGVVVPLYFLHKARLEVPLVHVSMVLAQPQRLYLFGVAVRKAAKALGRKVALLASGDLSHGLTHDAPAGYLPRGKEFDGRLAELLAAADVQGIIRMDPELISSAGECGYRSIVMMLGALDGCDVKAEVLSYEGPFGVGYLVASLVPGSKNIKKSFLQEIYLKPSVERERQQDESYLVRLARRSLEDYVNGLQSPVPKDVPGEFEKKAGVFVSIKKQGQLRGCIGTIEPVQACIAEEVMANAISAGMHDPRFQPVSKGELRDLDYSVDVLQPPEKILSMQQLDPTRYGVIVESGKRSGLLLPNLAGVNTVAQQVDIARQKAGIGPNEPVILKRFKVERYK